jgi:hypothetical protein
MCLSGGERREAEDYVGQYDEAVVWEGDLTRAAELARMANTELSSSVAPLVVDCLDNRQLGQCVMAVVESVL